MLFNPWRVSTINCNISLMISLLKGSSGDVKAMILLRQEATVSLTFSQGCSKNMRCLEAIIEGFKVNLTFSNLITLSGTAISNVSNHKSTSSDFVSKFKETLSFYIFLPDVPWLLKDSKFLPRERPVVLLLLLICKLLPFLFRRSIVVQRIGWCVTMLIPKVLPKIKRWHYGLALMDSDT